ncbi:dephospho-CoA kinase [Pseudoroseicyclus tamaricis]|uniref:Dephospho-CoA kinase n=1 Tax=Pseudoroseicyclus tamaricis TaxID=2705421 RepID=A0A6B2JMG6_9RHOB|nr:dephospho-CoA kinase [Pseudoroseicyclus tamaricis]NDV02781.1 dephospho-CoA kinase [Pseudoroseicyclus tamaricis]
MISLGLTGSIGTGKSTTAQMFAEEGAAIWDADAAVHRLYGPGGAAGAALEEDFHDAVRHDGSIDRVRLAARVTRDPAAFERLEEIIHPLARADRFAFMATVDADVVVCDIPLLFETALDLEFDATIVTTCPPQMQRRRVLARKGMTEERFNALLARQMPDAEKQERASYVIVTDTPDHARAQVREVLADVLVRYQKPENPDA